MIELKSRYSEKKVLFKSEAATTVKEALVEAVNKKAYLRGAYLRDADLRDADLVDAGQDIRGYRFVGYWRDGLRILAGCRDFTVAEARAHWAGNAECAAKVALIETVAALRGLGKEAAKTEAA